MQMLLFTTARCNASCRHCSTSCGPLRTESLPNDRIFKLMDDAAELRGENEKLSFYLSGGEPFLEFERLLEIVAHGKALGANVTCVTNGYWATSPEKALAMVTAIHRAGLEGLGVSTSPFHQAFVKRQRVERVLNAAREVGLRCGLKYIRSASDPQSPAEVEAWARAAGANTVEHIDLLPYLSEGQTLPEAEYPRTPGLPEGRCPSALLTIREDGEAFTCAANGALTDLLALGNAHELGLRELRSRFYLGGAQQLLRKHGPIHFARAVQAEGKGERLRPAYQSVCDLCAHIACDPVMSEIAAKCVVKQEKRQMLEMFERAGMPLEDVNMQELFDATAG